MCTSLVCCDRGDVSEEVVDTGEPVVRGLRASAALVRAKTRLGGNAAVNDNSAYGAIRIEIPSRAPSLERFR
jgi:hypothetical protein